MRAGNLDRVIEIQRRTTGLDLYGTPVETWTTFATMRAQLLKNTADNEESSRGPITNVALSFRTRWLPEVMLNHRVVFEGQQLEITGITEIGRRRGVDLICRKIG